MTADKVILFALGITMEGFLLLVKLNQSICEGVIHMVFVFYTSHEDRCAPVPFYALSKCLTKLAGKFVPDRTNE